jgi:hypothetical protein
MSFLGVSSDAWFPVITLIIGATLKGVFDLMAEERANRRAQQNRDDQRRDTLRLKRLEFQQTTLLEFQEVVARLARFYGRAHYEDNMNFKISGEWQRSNLSEDVDKGLAAEQAIFGRLRVRIRDEIVRNLAAKFSDAAVAGLLSFSQKDASANMMLMSNYIVALNERVGILLRELELSEDEITGDGNC